MSDLLTALRDSWFDIYDRDGGILNKARTCRWTLDGDRVRLESYDVPIQCDGEPWRWELNCPGGVTIIAGVVNRRGKNRINFGGYLDGTPGGKLNKRLHKGETLSIHTFSLSVRSTTPEI